MPQRTTSWEPDATNGHRPAPLARARRVWGDALGGDARTGRATYCHPCARRRSICALPSANPLGSIPRSSFPKGARPIAGRRPRNAAANRVEAAAASSV